MPLAAACIMAFLPIEGYYCVLIEASRLVFSVYAVVHLYSF